MAIKMAIKQKIDQKFTIFHSENGVTVLQTSDNDYDYAYDLTMDGASPLMVYGLLFTCLISLMILFASKICSKFSHFDPEN